MIATGIARSFAISRLSRGLSSPLFYLCAVLAFLGLLFPARPMPDGWSAIAWFILAPFLEELTWRTIIQNELARFLGNGAFFGLANLLASVGFATAHFAVAPGLMSTLTFFPSLIFGGVWTKFHSTWLCGLLHLWYNFVFRFPL
ncbi:MAG: CPBP family intramembrane metalloprotease [Desulfovibrio sp.]|nr:CPBP family intramembrane metalloprotease [Desulfovibrio sp.]